MNFGVLARGSRDGLIELGTLEATGPFQSHCEECSHATIAGEVGWPGLYELSFRHEIAIRQRRTRNDKSDFEKALVRPCRTLTSGGGTATLSAAVRPLT